MSARSAIFVTYTLTRTTSSNVAPAARPAGSVSRGVPCPVKYPDHERARAKAIARVEILRAGGNRDDRVHERPQHQLVARSARGDLIAERTVLVNGRVLKEVKWIRHLPFGDPPRLQRLGEVRPAASVALDAIIETVAAVVAHRGDDVVPGYVVPDDLEHRAPPVRFEPVTDPYGQPQQC